MVPSVSPFCFHPVSPPPHVFLSCFLHHGTSLIFFYVLPPVSESKELPEVVRTVLKQEITRLFGDSNAKSFNQAYLTKHSNSIPHRLAGRHAQFFSLLFFLFFFPPSILAPIYIYTVHHSKISFLADSLLRKQVPQILCQDHSNQVSGLHDI